MSVRRRTIKSKAKVQRGVKPRLAVTMRKKQIEPARILDRFYEDSNFIARTGRKEAKTIITKRAWGKITAPQDPVMHGLMYSRVEVSVLQTVSRMTAEQVYNELDALSERGFIGITSIPIKPSTVIICAIVGEATHNMHRQSPPHVTRTYKSHPLSEGERKKYISNVREAIKNAGDRMQKEMESRHGKPSTVELELLKEDNQEGMERARLMSALSKKLAMDMEG